MTHNKCLNILFLLAFFICWSCHNLSESRIAQKHLVSPQSSDSIRLRYVGKDTLRFNPPVNGEYISFQETVQDEKSFWIGLNPDENRLDIFSLDTKKHVKSIFFDYEGPNGIDGRAEGFFYHNKDSIFMLSSDANTVFLIDDKGILAKEFDFMNKPLPDGFTDYSVFAHEGVQNGPYYIPSTKTLQLYVYRWNNGDSDEYERPMMVSYSIEKDEFVSSYGLYPSIYQSGNDYLFYEHPSVVVNDNISFIQFGLSEYLVAYDNKSGEVLRASNDHCEHWKGPAELLPDNHDFKKGSDWLIQQAAFPVLLMDQKNERIYQILKHRQVLKDTNGNSNDLWFGNFCINIFDLELRRIGHEVFPKDQYLPVVSFVALGQLWIKNPIVPQDENTSLFYSLSFQ